MLMEFVNLFYMFSLFAFYFIIKVLGIIFFWGGDMFLQRTFSPLGLVLSNPTAV